MEGSDNIDELQRVLLIVSRGSHMLLKQLHQILGQVVGWVANGVVDGPERNSFPVDLHKSVQSRRPQTLWPQLLDDILGKR
jgi:hypothetical protein